MKTLCVVFYGHPTVFAQSALEAAKKIQEENGNAVILPAVSSIDCLFSDLKIDPGNNGCFFIDATELLIKERRIDIYSHVILLQIFNLGRWDTKSTTKLGVLSNYLRKYYLEDQPICIYQASILPMQKPLADWITLKQITEAMISPISTLYIPPSRQKIRCGEYFKLLRVDE